uniref:Putative ribonuclease H-like domain-containing protein n=1 Tax=Tanacetum cinerariifolium TaxID=118510 RepID=A0A6L2JR74_TANCI|nr:putative ribonuclease H-like domain-containing protein [Tanacetum cinerariifolium]
MDRIIRDQGGISQVLNEDFHTCMFACFLSQEEPKRVYQALKDLSLIEAMQEELLQFKMQKVWILVDLPQGKREIGTKWVYINKKDERGIVVRYKARLVSQGHTQEEGIDYEEVFAPVSRIEAIRLFLAYASFMGFMVYQMDVKSAFLYGTIEEEVYVCQPPRFEDPNHPNKVYKVVKALYGLHQAPRAWYETLANYLLQNGFHRGQIDQTLFIKKQKGDILLVQIYMYDIIFGATNKDLYKSFKKLMKDKFQMSSMRELTFFLGLQVKQKEDGIFINQDKYVAEILKFGLTEGKSASTPIDTEKPLLKDPDGEDVDVHIYRSMIGSLMYLTSSRPDIMFAFWKTVAVKSSNNITRLQALVDKKKVVVTDAAIRDALHLDDAKGVDCLPNEEICNELARMGYEKPTTKLTFYKAFFFSQWKFLIHTILQSMSAKRTSWNEFSLAMASAVICLSTGRKFNFSKYIFESLVRNVDSSTKFYMYPRFITLIIQNQLGDLSTYSTKYISLALTQKVFANMRRVGKECSGVEIPLFEGMLIAREHENQGNAEAEGDEEEQALTRRVEYLEHDKVAQDLEILKLKSRVKKLERPNKVKSMKLKRLRKVRTSQRIESSADTVVEEMSNQVRVNVADAQVEGSGTVSADAVVHTPDTTATVTPAPVKVVVPATRRRRGVIIRDPEEESSTNTPAETKSKDKGKGILVEEPKPMKKKQQVEMDEAFARKLQEEFNQEIDWEVEMKHVKQSAKECPYVQKYQVMKKRPVTEAQARRNMMVYLKNNAGYILDYFKEMSYDDIRLIFEAKFNSNLKFLLKTKEKIEEEESRAIAIINETPAQKAAKRRRLNKEAENVEELKQHLEIVPDEDDNVFTKATPLARKVPVVDYQIMQIDNKPRYKIICVDDTHQLYKSFITMLKFFDREDLETLWNIVKASFGVDAAIKLKEKHSNCLLLPVKILVLPDKIDAAGYYCWIVLLR